MSCGWKTFGNWSLTLPSNANVSSLPQGIVCAQLRLLLGNFGPFKRPSKTRVGCITPNGTLFLHSGEICSWEPAPGNFGPGSLLHFVSPLDISPQERSIQQQQTTSKVAHAKKKNPSSLHFTSQKVVCADAGSHTAATLLVFFSWCSFSSQKRQHCET